ncbi:MAG: hypothetical protein AAF747_07430 [Planctomycetota bacterium]
MASPRYLSWSPFSYWRRLAQQEGVPVAVVQAHLKRLAKFGSRLGLLAQHPIRLAIVPALFSFGTVAGVGSLAGFPVNRPGTELWVAFSIPVSIGAGTLAVVWSTRPVFGRIVRAFIREQRCIACDYSLIDTPSIDSSITCPECGRVAPEADIRPASKA